MSILSLTAQWWTDFQKHKVIPHCEEMSEAHTAANLTAPFQRNVQTIIQKAAAEFLKREHGEVKK